MSTSPRHARRRYRTTFYHRLVGSFLVVSTILVLLISTVSYQLLYRQYTREIAANHQRVIEYDGRALASDIFQKGQRLFADLSMNPQYTQVLSYFCQHPAEADHVMLLNVYESLRSLQAVYPDLLSSVMIHYPQQQFLISSTHGFKRQEEIQNQPFQAIVDSFPSLDVGRISWWTMADAHSLPNLHDNQILFGGIPAWNSNLGKHAAQVYLFVNSATVSSMLNNIAMEGSATYFLGQNGEAIASSASGVANMRLPEDVWQALQDSNERYVSMASTQDGIESLYTVCSIPSAPWKLALVMPMADYMRTARSIIGQIAIGVVASLALLLPLTAYVSRRLYTPVQQLAALVRQLPDQEGELSRSEHEAISACIQRLSTRLSQAERQLYIQKPILRHVQLQRLLDGGQDKDGGISSESLQMAGISFPHAYFAAVYCEWIAAEGQAETEVESIRFSLIAEMEEKFKQADFCLYGYAVDRTHTAWVLNAAQPDHIAAVQIAQTAEAYMQGLGLPTVLFLL